MPRAVILSIALLLFLLLLWAIFGKLDIVASAQGKLVPQGYLKIVQPADAGVVQEILVKEGDLVEAGQLLMQMDTNLTDANARANRDELAQKGLQLRRIDAQLAGRNLQPEAGDMPALFAQVSAQQAAATASYRDALGQAQSALEKNRHELHAAAALLEKLQQAVPAYRRSALAFARLGNSGFHSPLAVEEKQRELMEKERDLQAQAANVASLQASVAAAGKRLAQVTSQYRSELHNERAEADLQYRRLLEESNKIGYQAGRLSLRAPQRGIIKDVNAHTQGTVVAPGSMLMSLIPAGQPLQAEVLVNNEDVGFVHHAQRVKLKLLAYPFQKYGMVDGTVIHIGPDASDAAALPGAVTGVDMATAGGLRYKALVKLDRQQLETNGKLLPLNAGMQVVAEIHQGRRTVMAYLLSPVQKAWQEAARER